MIGRTGRKANAREKENTPQLTLADIRTSPCTVIWWRLGTWELKGQILHQVQSMTVLRWEQTMVEEEGLQGKLVSNPASTSWAVTHGQCWVLLALWPKPCWGRAMMPQGTPESNMCLSKQKLQQSLASAWDNSRLRSLYCRLVEDIIFSVDKYFYL